MTRIATMLALCFLTCPTLAGEDLTDAREILEKADQAIRKVSVISYRAEYGATTWVQQFVPGVTGKAILGKPSKWDIPRFWCDVKLQKYGSEEVQEFTAGCDGDVYFLIDPKTKMAHEDMDDAVLGSQARNIQRALLPEFSRPKPFGDILEPEGDPPTIELKGTAKVGDVECYQVSVKHKSPPELLWSISKKDFLPRKVVRTYKNPQGEEGTTELAMFDLKINPKLDKDPYKLVTPPGFTKTDEFAP